MGRVVAVELRGSRRCDSRRRRWRARSFLREVAASSSSDSLGVDLVERFLGVVWLGARAGAVVGIRVGTLWDCGGLLIDGIVYVGERGVRGVP